MNDHELAARLARAAGDVLMALRPAAWLAPADLGRAGDAAAHAVIDSLLRCLRPHDALLSEEGQPAASGVARTWIVDPLDGTREYAEPPRSDWAVHVALCDGARPVAGAVALPALGRVFGSADPGGLAAAPAGRPRILVSRTRPPEIATRVARRVDAELVPMGSAGAKAMAVLEGRAHAYLHAGGLSVWDSCAPVVVALARGAHASRIDGSPCAYQGNDTSMPDLLICRPELAAPLLEAIREEQRRGALA